MTRHAVIELEKLDVDITYGDYDGHTTKYMWYIHFYEDGKKVDGNGYTNQDRAQDVAAKFVAGDFTKGQYGELIFE